MSHDPGHWRDYNIVLIKLLLENVIAYTAAYVDTLPMAQQLQRVCVHQGEQHTYLSRQDAEVGDDRCPGEEVRGGRDFESTT